MEVSASKDSLWARIRSMRIPDASSAWQREFDEVKAEYDIINKKARLNPGEADLSGGSEDISRTMKYAHSFGGFCCSAHHSLQSATGTSRPQKSQRSPWRCSARSLLCHRPAQAE
jgi:hypothetical protein